MATAIGVRSDFTAPDLRRFSRRCDDPDQVRRVLAVALILDGSSLTPPAARSGADAARVLEWFE